MANAQVTDVGEARIDYPAEGVGRVTIHNPPMNMWYLGLAEKMFEAMQEIKEAGARVLILRSDVPGYFLAHMSLEDSIARREGREPTGKFEAMGWCGRELRIGPMVSIVVNNGQCWGGGCELFSTANLRVAGESATFGQPEVIIGSLAAGAGASRIPRLIGEARAMELLLDGRPISARKALHWGFVNRVYPDDQLQEKAVAWAALIASRPAHVLQAIKKAVSLCLDQAAYRDAVRVEQEVVQELVTPNASVTTPLRQAVVERYRAGMDSWDAWQITRGDIQDWEG